MEKASTKMATDDLYIRSLKPIDLNEMYFAFLDAFSDYPLEFRLNKEQFVRKFVEKLKIDFSLSLGAFDYQALAGFIFSSVNYYENKLTAYNGGTGVRPNYRGRKITAKMYDYLLPKLIERGVKQCVLEVLVQNKQAINVYESIGFKKKRKLLSFKLTKPAPMKNDLNFSDLEILYTSQPQWLKYEEFHDFNPSFLDSSSMVMENIANENIIEVYNAGNLIGYAIYQPALGRISQIAVKKEMRRRSIASTLLEHIQRNSQLKTISITNVNEDDKRFIKFLESTGFNHQLSQYEMSLLVND